MTIFSCIGKDTWIGRGIRKDRQMRWIKRVQTSMKMWKASCYGEEAVSLTCQIRKLAVYAPQQGANSIVKNRQNTHCWKLQWLFCIRHSVQATLQYFMKWLQFSTNRGFIKMMREKLIPLLHIKEGKLTNTLGKTFSMFLCFSST